jgi:hypothetical protein
VSGRGDRSRAGMDPRSVRLDPGGERYFARTPIGSRAGMEIEPGRMFGRKIDAAGAAAPVAGHYRERRADNATCPTCGARAAAGCEHLVLRRPQDGREPGR